VSGRMTGWEDRDPANFELDGSVEISNGQIADDGTFSAQMAGNVERTRRGPDLQGESPSLVVFSGDATGAFYDGSSGQRARVVRGEFSGTSVDGGDVAGQFIADR
jgi:hypothetical protein